METVIGGASAEVRGAGGVQAMTADAVIARVADKICFT
jgi:hypothetical protein